MPRKFKKDKDRLQIRWKTRQYYFDIFDPDFFSEEVEEEERKHGIFYEDDENELMLSCKVTIAGSFACLTYKKSQVQPKVDEGDVLIYFTSPKRDQVSRIDWRSSDGTLHKYQGTSNWDASGEAEEGRERVREARCVDRNRDLAEKRKAKDGNKCQACGYQLEVNGSQIIDVHHLEPMASRRGTRITSIEDLVCLCPNCHRIAHTSTPPLTVKQVKSLLTKSSSGHAKDAPC